MNTLNVTEYDNMTDDFNDSLSIKNNCQDNENNIDIFIQALFLQYLVVYHFYD